MVRAILTFMMLALAAPVTAAVETPTPAKQDAVEEAPIAGFPRARASIAWPAPSDARWS